MAILRCLIQHSVRKMSFQMQITGIKPVQLGLEEMTLAYSGCSSTWVPLGGGAGLFARVFAAAVLSWLVSTAVGGDSDQEEGRWRLAAQNTTNHTYTHIYRGITCDWNADGMLVWDVMCMENVALCWYDEFYITHRYCLCTVLCWDETLKIYLLFLTMMLCLSCTRCFHELGIFITTLWPASTMGQLLSSFSEEELSHVKDALGSLLYDTMLEGGAVPDLAVVHPLHLTTHDENFDSRASLQEQLRQVWQDFTERRVTLRV